MKADAYNNSVVIHKGLKKQSSELRPCFVNELTAVVLVIPLFPIHNLHGSLQKLPEQVYFQSWSQEVL